MFKEYIIDKIINERTVITEVDILLYCAKPVSNIKIELQNYATRF